MNLFDDRTSEEKLPQNQDVVTFLRHITAPQNASPDIQAQVIARVRSRLLEEGQLESEHISYPIVQPLEQTEIRQREGNSAGLVRKRPIWQQRFSLLVAVLCVALLVGSFVAVEQLARNKSTTVSSPMHDSGHKTVTVHMRPTDFMQHTVVLHKGMRLLLVAEKGVQHLISNGYWKNISQSVLIKEKGIPNVDFAIVDSKVIGPFNVTGTYHLLDTIHAGMNLVVIVADVEVHMSGSKFKQSSAVIHKGMSIVLIADGHGLHIISNGYWANSNAVPLKEKGIPKVDFIRIGYDYPDSHIIGPFNTVGTYHLYDTIHGDMNLTVIVKE